MSAMPPPQYSEKMGKPKRKLSRTAALPGFSVGGLYPKCRHHSPTAREFRLEPYAKYHMPKRALTFPGRHSSQTAVKGKAGTRGQESGIRSQLIRSSRYLIPD